MLLQYFIICLFNHHYYSDLNPVLSPKWSMRMRTSEKPSCSMGKVFLLFSLPKIIIEKIIDKIYKIIFLLAEYLKEFAMLSQGYDADNQLLVNAVSDEDEIGMFICF